jgi:zinc-binding alcohol dehydrogenase family protein
MIGGLSGPATELNPGLIFARRANVQGISVGSMQMFEAMSRAIAASSIKPVLDKVFHFDEAQAAYRHMASGAHFYPRSVSRFSFQTPGGPSLGLATHIIRSRRLARRGWGKSRPAPIGTRARRVRFRFR